MGGLDAPLHDAGTRKRLRYACTGRSNTRNPSEVLESLHEVGRMYEKCTRSKSRLDSSQPSCHLCVRHYTTTSESKLRSRTSTKALLFLSTSIQTLGDIQAKRMDLLRRRLNSLLIENEHQTSKTFLRWDLVQPHFACRNQSRT